VRILVVGGGGREHALCWKIKQSPLVTELHCAPGNGGISEIAECVDLAATDTAGLLGYAKLHKIDLTVIGPEEPLCRGIVDQFKAAGLVVFGPDRIAAEVEGSKALTREICKRHKIPSPSHWTFEDKGLAMAFLENHRDEPMVVKASGLAAGKGVAMCTNHEQARTAIQQCMELERFGEAGRTVVIEEWVKGNELSALVLTDGQTIIPLETAQDYKAVKDNNQGPNTGGMGAISPPPWVNQRTLKQVESHVLIQMIHALNREGRRFQGILYAGLMITASGPRVLEFNARFGDPETQALLPRLKSDLVPLLLHAAKGTLEQVQPPVWDPRPAVCVVAASGGYPGDYTKGHRIGGLMMVEQGPDLHVFHSGTTRKGSDFFTAGGRVLSVVALGDDLRHARARAYEAIAKIEFAGMHYRRDIGQKSW
jgi:phosphoribosylamine--glycine ligase